MNKHWFRPGFHDLVTLFTSLQILNYLFYKIYTQMKRVLCKIERFQEILSSQNLEISQGKRII